MEKTSILEMVKGILLPKEIASCFDISNVKELKGYLTIELIEKINLTPRIKGKIGELVSDGYLNPLELQTFPLKGKETYLKIYRRRWKDKEGNQYSNQYDINPEGVKATKEFAIFLKGTFRQTPDQYNNYRRSIMR